MTERHEIGDIDLTSLVTEDEFDEIYDGASTHAPVELAGSPVIEDDGTGVGNAATGHGVITLRNIQVPEQAIGICRNKKYTGKTVYFHEGVLITKDRDIADIVLASCPDAREEPVDGPMFTHPETKFSTRSPEIFTQYTTRLGDSRV